MNLPIFRILYIVSEAVVEMFDIWKLKHLVGFFFLIKFEVWGIIKSQTLKQLCDIARELSKIATLLSLHENQKREHSNVTLSLGCCDKLAMLESWI